MLNQECLSLTHTHTLSFSLSLSLHPFLSVSFPLSLSLLPLSTGCSLGGPFTLILSRSPTRAGESLAAPGLGVVQVYKHTPLLSAYSFPSETVINIKLILEMSEGFYQPIFFFSSYRSGSSFALVVVSCGCGYAEAFLCCVLM